MLTFMIKHSGMSQLKIPSYMKPVGSWPCSQARAVEFCCEPAQSVPHIHRLFPSIRFDITLLNGCKGKATQLQA
jgi:hypothetical protein